MNEKTLKVLSFVVMVAGFGINLSSGLLSEKALDLKIDQKVMDALNRK